MTQIRVDFEREHGDGLQFSNIYLNGRLLPFTNHKAAALLEPGAEFDLYWRILGEPGAYLTLTYTVDGVEKTAIDKSTIPDDRTRLSDFTFLTL